MHELAVTQNILDLTLLHAEGRTVTAIHLVIGELSSMVDDCVQFYWDIISHDTPAEGAMLVFERVPAQFRCVDCGTVYLLRESDLACPACESVRVELLCGDEFYLSAIDVEDGVQSYADENTSCRECPERQ
jgi:hydrogenase nickel incorporation protein HypA/HybF